MARPSEIEAKAAQIAPGEPVRETIIWVLNMHETISDASNFLNVSVSALSRYIDKNKIPKVTRWGEKLAT
jgi:hypothetical protein